VSKSHEMQKWRKILVGLLGIDRNCL